MRLIFVLLAALALFAVVIVLQPQPVKEEIGVEIVAQNLEVPWSLDFAPDGRLFFTERAGQVSVVDKGQVQLVTEFPVASGGEAGLLGLALDPDFLDNGYIYVYYTYQLDGNLFNRVSRFRETKGEEEIILDSIPGARIHDGGRIKFGPDNRLYITTGDATVPALAQDLDSLAGKILRINPDGSVPEDNPFEGSPVYSYGHRNPQGLAWHPATGKLYITEHGAIANDEINLIEPGKNYGWPSVECESERPEYTDPLVCFRQTVALSGSAFFRNSLFFASLRGAHLHRLDFAPPNYTKLVQEEVLLTGYGRIRDVVQGPDGRLYIATSNRDGRGSPSPRDDLILRIRQQVL